MKKAMTIILMFSLVMAMVITPVQAKEKSFIHTDPEGNMYIVKNGVLQFGWVNYEGNTYYCHKIGTKKYPKGSVTRGEMKIRTGNRWYAFDARGRLIKGDKNGEYRIRKGARKYVTSLILNKDHTVKYVLNTAACYRWIRYSTAARRRQEEQPNGKWKSVGKAFYPDYVDHQK